MPLNWDVLDHEVLSDISAADEPWEAEPQDQYQNFSDDLKAEEDNNSQSRIEATAPMLTGVCPHCGSNFMSEQKPSGNTSTEVEVFVYTDCNRTSSQGSPASTTPSSSCSVDIKPNDQIIIDLTLSDNEGGHEADSDSVRINPYTGKRVNRWTEDEKTDLYVLKLAYSVNNEELSRILSQKHQKFRGKNSVVAQFTEYRYTALNKKLYLEVATAIINDKLYKYSSFTSGLKSAARRVGVVLVLRRKEDIRIADTPLTCRNTRRDRGPDDENSDSDSSVSSSKRLVQKLAPEILYRAYNWSSHGRNGVNGFRAGKFAGSDNQVPILAESELEGFDVSLACHIEGEKMDEGSYFVSTTPSLLWALHKAFMMRKNARISIIDRSKIRQPIQHISTIRPRMRAKGLLEGISYSGKLEYVVYGEIEADGIINDFSLEEFLQMVNSDNQIQKVLGSDILFNRAYQKSLMKFDLICQSPIRRWSLAHVISTVFRFVFDQQQSHPLGELFKANLSIDWGLEERME
ncbi:hypothetical protein TWF788_002650 [Orbilia oligospora]|uniref:DUF7587 domain-containing protein n=3 Tax=Orbilia oligospora TaxID=2813651 RepID=A0A7C8Q0R7_ORBOL|nr:hypothetical protein TWF788_002650 [Orbilia oligospora]